MSEKARKVSLGKTTRPNVAGVLHKGVIREIARQLTGEAMPKDEPGLGEIVALTRIADGPWVRGVRSSDPPGLAAA